MEPLKPEEFEEIQEQAAEDELDHLVEQFDSAEDWNAYVAALESHLAERNSSALERKVETYEALGKGVAIGLGVLLVCEGLDAVLGRRVR